MGEQEDRDVQEAPGTEEQTGDPDAEVGEQAVPDDEPGAGVRARAGRIEGSPSASTQR